MDKNKTTISLTRGLVAIIDEKNFDRLSKYSWQATFCKNGYVRVSRMTKRDAHGKRKCIGLAREILGLSDSRIHVDHINGNTLDNREENIRMCSAYENMKNRIKKHKSSSKFKGVSWSESHKRWVCRVFSNGKKVFHGYFKDEMCAAKKYNEIAIVHHKEFAKLNNF